MINTHVMYKGLPAQQHPDAFKIFYDFLKEIKPARILEIGTADGGFTFFLREALNSIGLSATKVRSVDILCKPNFEVLQNYKIDINIVNLFDDKYTYLLFPDIIKSYIQQEGTTLVLCDGGNKITEFNTISPLIKKGDFIMAHDYVDTRDNFIKNFRGKIWNWCEIEEKHIADICTKAKLSPYNQEIFSKVVWACRKK